MDEAWTTPPPGQGTSDRSLKVLLMSSRQPLDERDVGKSVADLKAEVLGGLHNVTVDNPDADWKILPIGSHLWLLKVLEDFAASEQLAIHVRFVHWHRALHDIAHVYGRDYDVIQVPSTFLAYLADMGTFRPLPDLCPSLYVGGLLESCQTESEPGVHYAVPWHADARVVYYRDEDEKEPSWADFQDFVEWLRTRQGDDKEKRPFGVAVGPDGDILHTTLYYFLGGHIIEPDSGGQWMPVFDDEKRVGDGLRQLDAIAREGLVRWLTPAPDERTSQTSAKALLKGQCDAVFGGPWMWTVFKRRPRTSALPSFPICCPARSGSSAEATWPSARRQGNAGMSRCVWPGS
ncbi:MAG: extracellular solute-binding protein [Acidobacteria bacterium]|nr:extracellular solute-binding protein [Planctomycetota bacterium]MBE3135547.1 extracellular solute-binding protein [Acidobacteriota bacterium]